MYRLKETWFKISGAAPIDQWDGKLYCCETDPDITYRANIPRGYTSAYIFTLVLQGRVNIVYNGRELTLCPDDIYIYSPGLPLTVISASSDYRGICLLAEEDFTMESPTAHDLIHLAYAPIVQLHEPKFTLQHDDAVRLAGKMREIREYLHSQHIYRNKILQMLYAIFLLELQYAQEKAIPHRMLSQRVEEIFIGFLRLLPQNFAKHHNIEFYANKLNISVVYLSRSVRLVSGRTVVDYINQFIGMEASFLLRTSNFSIAQIAERLGFADLPSFSKFFTRIRGMSPRTYREKEIV